MKSTAKHLLFLNDLSEQTLKELNSDKKLKVSCNALIKTSEVTFNKQEIDPNKTWVFTSRNAVEIILKIKFPCLNRFMLLEKKQPIYYPQHQFQK